MGARGRSCDGLTHAGPATLRAFEVFERLHPVPLTLTRLALELGVSYSHANDMATRLRVRGVVGRVGRGLYALMEDFSPAAGRG